MSFISLCGVSWDYCLVCLGFFFFFAFTCNKVFTARSIQGQQGLAFFFKASGIFLVRQSASGVLGSARKRVRGSICL